jgi:aromatic ring hydroxylase
MPKTEPVSYSAIEEAERDAAERSAMPRQMAPNEKPRIEMDPLTSFEHFHHEMQAILNSWMTLTLDSRTAKAKEFAKGISSYMRESFRMTRERRHKILNYVIWIESIHPHGDRDVAAIAFNGLFGIRKKEESK